MRKKILATSYKPLSESLHVCTSPTFGSRGRRGGAVGRVIVEAVEAPVALDAFHGRGRTVITHVDGVAAAAFDDEENLITVLCLKSRL